MHAVTRCNEKKTVGQTAQWTQQLPSTWLCTGVRNGVPVPRRMWHTRQKLSFHAWCSCMQWHSSRAAWGAVARAHLRDAIRHGPGDLFGEIL